MSKQGFNAVQIGRMTTPQMIQAIKDVGEGAITEALEWTKRHKGHSYSPVLTLKSDYQVTFEDPTKPYATSFKRFGCFTGDKFFLKGVRTTSKNFIFRFAPGDNVRRNMARHRLGPGLKTEYETAEFTTTLLKNGDRLNGREFMEDVLFMHYTWLNSGIKVNEMYGDETAGSW